MNNVHRFQSHPLHFRGEMEANPRIDHAFTSFAGGFSLAVTVVGCRLTVSPGRVPQSAPSKSDSAHNLEASFRHERIRSMPAKATISSLGWTNNQEVRVMG